jgi:hypothetical protein
LSSIDFPRHQFLTHGLPKTKIANIQKRTRFDHVKPRFGYLGNPMPTRFFRIVFSLASQFADKHLVLTNLWLAAQQIPAG